MERELYRRRQRRRGIVAWSVLALLVVAVGLVVTFGNEGDSSGTRASSLTGFFPAEMSAEQFGEIHRGQSEAEVLQVIGVPGQVETELEDAALLSLFPPEPSDSSCQFWRLSEAPDHLVRLCFGGTPAALEQKSVAAAGEDEAPQTLV